jgi:hypothetical protein
MRVMSPFVSGSNPTLGLNNELHSTEFQEKRGGIAGDSGDVATGLGNNLFELSIEHCEMLFVLLLLATNSNASIQVDYRLRLTVC